MHRIYTARNYTYIKLEVLEIELSRFSKGIMKVTFLKSQWPRFHYLEGANPLSYATEIIIEIKQFYSGRMA